MNPQLVIRKFDRHQLFLLTSMAFVVIRWRETRYSSVR